MNLPRPLSAKFKEDFAYPTVKDRLPVILTKVVDTLHRSKNTIVAQKNGEEAVEELKSIVGRLSKLRHELQTNKPLLPLQDDLPDVQAWNDYLARERESLGGKDPSWFESSWLYTECYFYRRITEAVRLSDKLKDSDQFESQKQNALLTAIPACESLATFLQESTTQRSESEHQELFSDFIQISLWGNKCDLSISAGVENTQTVNAVTSLQSLLPHLLHNDMDRLWQHVNTIRSTKDLQNRRVDIILDNAGFELFTDLCLADFLLESQLVSKVRCHGKSMPWFVSDVTIEDLQWTLDQLENASNAVLKHYGKKWKQYLEMGVLEYKAHDFWTRPEDFAVMQKCCPDLYTELSRSDLLIFKGDLNYRKLAGDLKWDFETPFNVALRGFCPAPLCALRTLKCDLAVGIEQERANRLKTQEDDWMLTGRWGVIHFNDK